MFFSFFRATFFGAWQPPLWEPELWMFCNRSSFVFHKVKWHKWQNFHFWVNYYFTIQNRRHLCECEHGAKSNVDNQDRLFQSNTTGGRWAFVEPLKKDDLIFLAYRSIRRAPLAICGGFLCPLPHASRSASVSQSVGILSLLIKPITTHWVSNTISLGRERFAQRRLIYERSLSWRGWFKNSSSKAKPHTSTQALSYTNCGGKHRLKRKFLFSFSNECSVHLGQSVTSHLPIFPSFRSFNSHSWSKWKKHSTFYLKSHMSKLWFCRSKQLT